MRGFFESDFFGGQFGPRSGGMGGSFGGPFGCLSPRNFPGHHGPKGFGPFGHSFDHSFERNKHHQHGPEHHRRGSREDGHRGPGCHHGPEQHRSGSPEDGHRGTRCHHGPEHHRRGSREDGRRGPTCHYGSDSDTDGPAERHCHGPPGFRGRDGPRNLHGHGHNCHYSGPLFGFHPERYCFGPCGPSDFPDRPWRGPWEGPWGAHRHMRGFGRHGPWLGHRRPCPYDSEERRSRKADCENQPCCDGNKENRGRQKGRKGNEPCGNMDKDQNPGDTVFVQRIVLEKSTRPQSI